MNLENFLLSEISQKQKNKYCRITLYEVPRIGKLRESINRMVVTRAWGERDRRSYCLMGTDFQFEMVKKF